ncbi:MAG: hypothetical protein AAFP82_16035 [Bacteroidota bacterium]
MRFLLPVHLGNFLDVGQIGTGRRIGKGATGFYAWESLVFRGSDLKWTCYAEMNRDLFSAIRAVNLAMMFSDLIQSYSNIQNIGNCLADMEKMMFWLCQMWAFLLRRTLYAWHTK